MNTYCEILPYNKFPKGDESVKGVILSGSPFSVYDESAFKTDLSEIRGKYPILGICYGAQFMSYTNGGKVEPAGTREYGRAHLTSFCKDNVLFKGVRDGSQVWMSHGDTITAIPDNFKKIASTDKVEIAAYQVEGAWAEDGKKPSVWDKFVRIPGKTFKATTGDKAVDHYHMYKEDVRLMGEMGLKTYRFSIAWSRIYPDGNGQVNEKGLQFYDDLIDECLKYNIVPMITVYHWDLPQALEDQYHGWEDRRIVDDFVNYATTLFKRYGDRVKHWIILNEQNVFTGHGWMLAKHPPGKFKDMKTYYQVNHHAFMAHAKSVLALKELYPDALVGSSFAYGPAYAVSDKPEDQMACVDYEDLKSYYWMDVYAYGRYPRSAMKYLESLGVAPHFEEGDLEILKAAAAKVDFMGVNYYKTCSIEYNPLDGVDSLGGENNTGKKGTAEMEGVPGMYKVPANKNLPTTDWDWTIDPMGLRFACRKITSRYDLPIVISENGLGAFDKLEDGQIHDSYRIEYLRNHIEELKKACDDGCRILAYCTWSYTDLLSWLNGYQKRYGFVYVDRDEDENSGTLKRIPKDSYYWYKKVIETNGEEL